MTPTADRYFNPLGSV